MVRQRCATPRPAVPASAVAVGMEGISISTPSGWCTGMLAAWPLVRNCSGRGVAGSALLGKGRGCEKVEIVEVAGIASDCELPSCAMHEQQMVGRPRLWFPMTAASSLGLIANLL